MAFFQFHFYHTETSSSLNCNCGNYADALHYIILIWLLPVHTTFKKKDLHTITSSFEPIFYYSALITNCIHFISTNESFSENNPRMSVLSILACRQRETSNICIVFILLGFSFFSKLFTLLYMYPSIHYFWI